MPSQIAVKTAFGEYVFTDCQVSTENGLLFVKRAGVQLLWSSLPWTVTFT